MNLTIEDFTASSTIQFSAGANGNLYASVEGVSITSGGEADKGQIIRFFAVPNPGFHVEAGSWNDSGSSGANACADAPDGHGGPKTCVVTAGNGLSYNVTVGFATGALPADVPDAGDVPARNVAGVLSCMAFGGRFVPAITNDTCQDFAGAGSSCVIEGSAGANCQNVFNDMRDCNLLNQPVTAVDATQAAGSTATCGSACTGSQIALGGACEDANTGPFQVTFSPAGAVEAFRVDGTPVASGGYVSDNVVLSVVATPASGSFVAGWSDNCEVPVGEYTFDHDGNRRTPAVLAIQGDTSSGGFDDDGAKFCFVRVTMATNVTADVQVKPNNAPTYPIFGDDLEAGASQAENQANCELFGGTYDSGDDECQALDTNAATCLHYNPFGDATCGAAFDTMRTCLNANKPVDALQPSTTSPTGLRAVCQAACPAGQRAQGTSCVAAAAFVDNRVSYSPVVDDGGPLSGSAFEAPLDIAGKKKEMGDLSGGADNVRFVGGGGRFGFPSMLLGAFPSQALPPDVPASGDVPVNQANCEALWAVLTRRRRVFASASAVRVWRHFARWGPTVKCSLMACGNVMWQIFSAGPA